MDMETAQIKIIIICLLLIGVESKAQMAIGLHPFDKELSLRSNMSKNNFWDYRLAYDIGFYEGYGYIKHSIEVNWNYRIVNDERSKFGYRCKDQGHYSKFVGTYRNRGTSL